MINKKRIVYIVINILVLVITFFLFVQINPPRCKVKKTNSTDVCCILNLLTIQMLYVSVGGINDRSVRNSLQRSMGCNDKMEP